MKREIFTALLVVVVYATNAAPILTWDAPPSPEVEGYTVRIYSEAPQ